MKYIIDLPDNCSWVQWVMTSDKDGHAYFDFKSPEDLTTLDKELSEAYQKGYDEAWASVGECEDRKAYQKGLDDAWDVAKRIVLTKTDANCNYFTVAELEKIFGCSSSQSVFDTYSASEAIEEVKAHEQQKATEIRVGDEVRNTLGLMDNAVGYFFGDSSDGCYKVLRYVDGKFKTGIWNRENCVRTGGHSYAVERMVGVMKGEQSCSSCEYSNDPDVVRCRDCCGYNKLNRKKVKIERIFI